MDNSVDFLLLPSSNRIKEVINKYVPGLREFKRVYVENLKSFFTFSGKLFASPPVFS